MMKSHRTNDIINYEEDLVFINRIGKYIGIHIV